MSALQDAITDLRAAILEGASAAEAAASIGADYELNPALIIRKLAESANAPIDALEAALRDRAAHASKPVTRADLEARAAQERADRIAGERAFSAALQDWLSTDPCGRALLKSAPREMSTLLRATSR